MAQIWNLVSVSLYRCHCAQVARQKKNFQLRTKELNNSIAFNIHITPPDEREILRDEDCIIKGTNRV